MIEKIIITSFIVFAIWYSLQPDEIFGKLGLWFEKHLPEKIHPAIFECVVCMAGIYGAAIYWLIWHNDVKEWIIVNIAAIGFNAVLNKMFPPDEIELKTDE